MRRHSRLTIRARLTLLYTSLFAVCGGLVLAVSYTLVARLEPPGQSQPAPAAFLERCRAAQHSRQPNGRILAKCTSYFELQGAQHQRHLTLTHLLAYSLITLALTLLLAAALSWVAAGRALRPVHAISETARTASEYNLSARVALDDGPHDELHELATTIDAMLDRLQSAFEAQQRFIANASHELRTPLAVMRATVDVVLDDPHASEHELREMATDIRDAVDHAEHLIGALLLLARNERGLTTYEPLELATIAEDVLDTTDILDRTVHTTLAPAPVAGDPVLVERLIANLVDNAVRYNTHHGTIWITTRTVAGTQPGENEDTSQLTVTNTGPRLTQSDVDRIFEPFHRLGDRDAHDGYGLGLTIVASIATLHGGSSAAHPHNNGGLSVTVTLPKAHHTPDAGQDTPAHNLGNSPT